MSRAKEVTITQVAARAGTSPASVSYVFNGRTGAVGAAKRQQILAAADELGYRPNRRARQLRKQANMVLSIQIDSSIITDNRWRPTAVLNFLMVQGINSCATSRGYHLHLIVPASGEDSQEISAQVLDENAVDGVIFFGLASVTDAQRREMVERLGSCRIPGVTLDRTLAAEGMPRVSVDLQPAIEDAAACMVANGHQRIGYIGPRFMETLSEWIDRFELFERALGAHNAVFDPDMIIPQTGEVEAYQATCALLDRSPRPTCIVYSGENMAMAGAKAIISRGLTPGRDMSIVSFGNAPYIAASPIPLSVIDQRHHEQGATLARVLLDQIDRPNVEPPAVTLVRSRFVERDSLGPVRTT